MRLILSFVLVSPFLTIQQTAAQGQSALPFLLIHSSPEANAYGNGASSVVSTNPIAAISNPAHLGKFGFDNYFAVSLYTPKTAWLPSFGKADLTYNVRAASGGMNLQHVFSLPAGIALGFGYSEVELDLGEFIRVNSSGVEIARFRAFEKARQFSVGAGVEYFATLAVGWNFKSITSSLSAQSTGQPTEINPSATDFGMLLHADAFDILSKAGTNVRFARDFQPVLSVTAGYAQRNMGDEVRYTDQTQNDPLPRTTTLGMSLEVGIATMLGTKKWKILSGTLVREAEDLLVSRTSSGISYQSGFGDIKFFKHVIGGKLDDADPVDLHKGWQLNFGDFIYLRGGKFSESPLFGNRNYTTEGYGFHLGGLLRLMRFLLLPHEDKGVLHMLLDHIDVRYDYAKYTANSASPLEATNFKALTIVIR